MPTHSRLLAQIPIIGAILLSLGLTACNKPSIDGTYYADFTAAHPADAHALGELGKLLELTLVIEEPEVFVIATIAGVRQTDELRLKRTDNGFAVAGRGANKGAPMEFKVLENGDLTCLNCPQQSLPTTWKRRSKKGAV